MCLDLAKYKVSWDKMPFIVAEWKSNKLDKTLKKSWKTAAVIRVLSKLTKRIMPFFG